MVIFVGMGPNCRSAEILWRFLLTLAETPVIDLAEFALRGSSLAHHQWKIPINDWLVVYLPLCKILISWDPNIWKNNIYVPNHQPND